MKFDEAMKIIDNHVGYMVCFEKRIRGCLATDYFPDKHEGEELIESEEYAWELAEKFARRTKGSCVNIYVVDENFYPVKNYASRKISNQ